MCKGKLQPKNEGIQLGLFSEIPDKPAVREPGRIPVVDGSGVELRSRLTRQRAVTTHLLEKIADPANLLRAYRQVARNKGSAGVDGMDVEGLKQWLNGNLKGLTAALREQSWQVSPVRKVEIRKPSGGTRMLGIPTVRDRMIQQGIAQQLTPLYDPSFSEHSYGFRPGRGARQAIAQAAHYVGEGKVWVVDIDLEKFFDKINHDRLMTRLSKAIGDKRVLRLIEAYLKSGIMEGGLSQQRTAGTPQGGPLSPLLSNIVLDELDAELEKRGLSFCRYADDCNIFVASRKAAQRVMNSLIGFLEGKLKLKVNRAKSGVRHCEQVTFLGYTILADGGIRVADKSIERLKEKIRETTKRNRGVSFPQLIEELNAIVRGWTNYFRSARRWLTTLRDLDGWIRRKLRCYRLKQCGRKHTIYKFLRKLGVGKNKSWNVVMYSQGWWNMSNKPAVSRSMSPKWFAQQGLLSLYARMTVLK